MPRPTKPSLAWYRNRRSFCWTLLSLSVVTLCFTMRANLLSLTVLPAVVLAGAGKFGNEAIQSDGFVRYPLVPQQGAPLVGRHAKRQQGAESIDRRSGTLYTIDLRFGTPGQLVPVKVDTGSSELWTNPTCSKSSAPDFCRVMPRFTMSSTLVDLGAQGYISWARGNADDGDVNFQYVTDYVGIGCEFLHQRCRPWQMADYLPTYHY